LVKQKRSGNRGKAVRTGIGNSTRLKSLTKYN
jgi:hypothetical protein